MEPNVPGNSNSPQSPLVPYSVSLPSLGTRSPEAKPSVSLPISGLKGMQPSEDSSGLHQETISIVCGHCGKTHGSIAAVRNCSTVYPFDPDTYIAPSVEVVPEESLYEIPTTPQPTLGKNDKLREGIYFHGDAFYKIRTSKNGFPYAMLLQVDENDKHEWVYAPSVAKNLRHSERMEIEGLKNYGKETGRCILCGRELTNPVSVEQGIGPICAGRYS